MKRLTRHRLDLRVIIFASVRATVGCAREVTPSSVDAGTDRIPAVDVQLDALSPTECTTANQCRWGEIDHEIRVRGDCPCLSGCGFVPMNQTTMQRRDMQYQSLCTPGVDGMGRPCGVDDCISPPPLECRMNACVPPGG